MDKSKIPGSAAFDSHRRRDPGRPAKTKMAWLRYGLLLATVLLVGYHSVYFRKLSDVQSAEKAETFDAGAYAARFLHSTLPANTDKAIDLALLNTTLSNDPSRAFSWSHAQNDGNDRFFLVKGTATVAKIDSESVYLGVEGVGRKVALATRYVIGTAARDGSGLISVNDFTTTMDMNTVSEQLNNLIRVEVLPPFKASASPGERVGFIAGLELQRDNPVPDTLELTPMMLKIQ